MVTIDDIQNARNRIKNSIETTPLLTSDRLNSALPFDLYVKAECLQRTGSFKFRGGCNAVFSIEDSTLPVIAFSSGNHAQGVSLSASTLGIDAGIGIGTVLRAGARQEACRACKSEETAAGDPPFAPLRLRRGVLSTGSVGDLRRQFFRAILDGTCTVSGAL